MAGEVRGDAPIKVGDVMVFVSGFNRGGNPVKVTVAKVGRKWLELSNGYRAEIETLKVDGYSQHRLFRSEQRYHEGKEREHLLGAIARATDWSNHYKITLEQARQVAAILGINAYAPDGAMKESAGK